MEAEQDVTTDIISEDGNQVQQVSSSRQAVGSTVFTRLNLGSTASDWKQRERESLSGSRGCASTWKHLRDTTSVVIVKGQCFGEREMEMWKV